MKFNEARGEPHWFWLPLTDVGSFQYALDMSAQLSEDIEPKDIFHIKQNFGCFFSGTLAANR